MHPLLTLVVPAHATVPCVSSLEEHPLPTASPSSGGMLPAGQPGLYMHAWDLAQGTQVQAYCQLILL